MTKPAKLTTRDLKSPRLVKMAQIRPADLEKLLAEIVDDATIEEFAAALTAIIVASALRSESARRIALAAAWSRASKLNEPMPAKRREQLRLAKTLAPELWGLPARPAQKAK
ncbi:MAG: hypothetical protein MUE69_29090 [Myxococcota bacterium]|nr:hypothetical protein [Myxococcota bacterium]